MLGQVNEVQGKVLGLFAPLSPQVSGISLNCAASDRERDDYSNEKLLFLLSSMCFSTLVSHLVTLALLRVFSCMNSYSN